MIFCNAMLSGPVGNRDVPDFIAGQAPDGGKKEMKSSIEVPMVFSSAS
jgi:hypothetical protein